ncbi:MAG: metal-dependent hydrolase [Gemmatimonadaceae bacterium]
MDNITHTLAGALLAECGLKNRSRLAYPALLIGANLPDVDALAYLLGGSLDALSFRRGWTHGVLAMFVLPLLLAFALMGWESFRRGRTSVYSLAEQKRPTFTALAAVSAVGVLSHPLLDLLNNYGVRLLMPFSERWFYGDVAYIVDPWMMVILIAGIWLTRSRARGRERYVLPARVALGVLVLYVGAMAEISHAAVRALAREAGVTGLISPRKVMVAPEPFRVATRTGLVDTGDAYERWWVQWRFWGISAARLGTQIDKGQRDPRAVRASASPDGQRFLRWSRFPYFVSGVDGDSLLVHLGDARYSSGVAPTWATTRVELAPGGP